MKKEKNIQVNLENASPFYIKTKTVPHKKLNDYVSINFEVSLKKDEVFTDKFMLMNQKMLEDTISKVYTQAFRELWNPLKQLIREDILPQLKRIQDLENTNRKQNKKLLELTEQFQNITYSLKALLNHPLIDESDLRIKS